jgi:F0F1-type ATP synthase assembly protein I
MSKKNKPKQSAYLKYSSLGFQMAITIGLGAWLGTFLDEKYKTPKPYYTIAIILASIFIALYQVIKEVMSLNKEMGEKEKNKNTKQS